jgi:hypothetical protein
MFSPGRPRAMCTCHYRTHILERQSHWAELGHRCVAYSQGLSAEAATQSGWVTNALLTDDYEKIRVQVVFIL